jgi:hypothetical protein
LSLGVFVVIGMMTFVLGYLRIHKSIKDPFVRETGFVFKTAEQREQERIDRLRDADTDGDGLTDYDELYVFRTSPFLEDSDSDGTNDGAEIAAATDPNCPKGRTCRQPRLGTDATAGAGPTAGTTGSSGVPGETQEQRILRVITETFGDPNTLTPEEIAEGLERMSPGELRAFLVKLGIPEAALEKADDATLRALLKETLTELSPESYNPPGGVPEGDEGAADAETTPQE